MTQKIFHYLAASSDDRTKYFLVRLQSRVLDVAQQKHGLGTLPTYCQSLYCSFVRTQALRKINQSVGSQVSRTRITQKYITFFLSRKTAAVLGDSPQGVPTAA